jgi:hypothetical protein
MKYQSTPIMRDEVPDLAVHMRINPRGKRCAQSGQATLLNLRREHPGRFGHAQRSSSRSWTGNWPVIVHEERSLPGKAGQWTTFSTLNNAIFNDHPRDAAGAELARAYYRRRLRSLSVGDVVVIGEVALAVSRPAGWEPVSGSVNKVRTCEHCTRPLPVSAAPGEPVPGSPAKEYRDDCP